MREYLSFIYCENQYLLLGDRYSSMHWDTVVNEVVKAPDLMGFID